MLSENNAKQVLEAEQLRDQTSVGDTIIFNISRMDGEVSVLVIGEVIEKYPHIFRLDDGKTYRWADYALGYIR